MRINDYHQIWKVYFYPTKVNFFLVKLKLKFKNKILNINNIFKLREEILTIIII